MYVNISQSVSIDSITNMLYCFVYYRLWSNDAECLDIFNPVTIILPRPLLYCYTYFVVDSWQSSRFCCACCFLPRLCGRDHDIYKQLVLTGQEDEICTIRWVGGSFNSVSSLIEYDKQPKQISPWNAHAKKLKSENDRPNDKKIIREIKLRITVFTALFAKQRQMWCVARVYCSNPRCGSWLNYA